MTLREAEDRFDRLSLRERVLVLSAALGLVTLAWDVALMGPARHEQHVRAQQVEALGAEVSGLEQSAQAMAAQGATDPDRDNRQRVERLRQEIGQLDTQLAGATSGLIAPREMARVLQQVLAHTSRLRLRALRTLPPEPVIAPAPDGAAAGATQLYRHGLEIEVDGTYLEALDFVRALEALPWRFFWDHVEFAVEQHPRGRLKLVVYTLGLQQGWIGV